MTVRVYLLLKCFWPSMIFGFREEVLSEQVVMLWMERAIDGSAAGTHLRGTIARLEVGPHTIVRVIADRSSPDGGESLFRKLFRIFQINLRGGLAARPGRVLVGRFHPLMMPAVLIWRLVGGRVILSVQGALESASSNQYPRLGKSGLFRKVAAAPARLADGLIVGAPTIEGHVRSKMLRKNAELVVIPNGVFLDELQMAAEQPRPLEEPYVVFVGNLARWQAADILASAARHELWPSKLPLVVVGDGVDRGEVEFAENVLWKGRLPSAEARAWLAHAVCALSIQRSDVEVARYGYWPFKLIEGAAAGVPMVTSDAPGLAAAAADLGHSLVVPAQDAEATASAVAKLWKSPETRSRLISSGKVAAQKYDWRSEAVPLAEFVSLVANRNRSR